MPRVSIGMPVYNGENFIEEALKSICAQTFRDFELIISDNASTDRTEEICRSYAAGDSRIQYYRSPMNLGAAKNYNKVVELSAGEYFKYAAHDDIIAPDFLEKCVAVLNSDPGVVLVYPLTMLIDGQGRCLGPHDPDTTGFDSEKPYVRFGSRTSRIRPPLPFIGRRLEDAYPIFGLIRSSALKSVPLMGTSVGADQAVLARLALLGRFFMIPERLFYNRDHPQRFICVYRGRHLHHKWYDPMNAGKTSFSDWALFFQFLKAVHDTTLTPYQRLRCYGEMITYFLWNWPRMARDVLNAISQLVGSNYQRHEGIT